MKQIYKISIVVPVFNTKQYIEECVQSIIKQTYRNLEIIIIDDGSTDGSDIICDRIATIDDRIIVKHICNSGYSAARNLGISLAMGDYLTFVDSDDFIDENLIYEQMKSILLNSSDISICRVAVKYKNCTVFGDNTIRKKYISSYNDKMDLVFSTGMYINSSYSGGQCWRKLISKKILKNVYFLTDRDICEDELFSCQILRKARKVSFAEKACYVYRARKSSAVNASNFGVKILRGRVKLLKQCFITPKYFCKINCALLKNIIICKKGIIDKNEEECLYFLLNKLKKDIGVIEFKYKIIVWFLVLNIFSLRLRFFLVNKICKNIYCLKNMMRPDSLYE